MPVSIRRLTESAEHETVLNTSGYNALWAGFAICLLSTMYFVRASLHSHSKSSRIYHYITALITGVCSFAYLVMGVGMTSDRPLGPNFDFVWVHYADWVIATPMLLIDLAMLAGMKVPEVFFLCFMDIMMIGSGYGATISTTPSGTWPLYAFSCSCFMVIMVSLLVHLRAIYKSHSGTAESKAFNFLAVWTIGLWTAYPILFVLSKTHVMDLDAEAIIFCVLDVLAKCVFGAILVGSREALEGDWTPMAMMAMGITGINPALRRRNSVDITQMEEIRESYAAMEAGRTGMTNPMHKAKAAGGSDEAGQSESGEQESMRVTVRQGEDTYIYNKNVNGKKASASSAPQQQYQQQQAPAAPQDPNAALLALLSNPALAAQLTAALTNGQAPAAATTTGLPRTNTGNFNNNGNGSGAVSPNNISRRNSGQNLVNSNGNFNPVAGGSGAGNNSTNLVSAILANALMNNGNNGSNNGVAPTAAH